MLTVLTVTVIVSEKESFVMSNSTCNALMVPWPAQGGRSKSESKGSQNTKNKPVSAHKYEAMADGLPSSEPVSAPSRALSKLGDIWARIALSWDRPGLGVDARVAKPLIARERDTVLSQSPARRRPAPAPWAWPSHLVSEKR